MKISILLFPNSYRNFFNQNIFVVIQIIETLRNKDGIEEDNVLDNPT